MLDTITKPRHGGNGRPSCDEAIQARHRNERATDNLLKLLMERHPDDPEWSKYTSRQIAKPAKSVPVPVAPPAPDWLSLQDVIATPLTPPAPAYPKVEAIQLATAKHYGVTRHDIISSRRTANIVRPRQVAAYLSKTLTLRSLPDIGRRFGNRDHTTILHAVRKIAALVKSDAELAADVDAIRRAIRGSE